MKLLFEPLYFIFVGIAIVGNAQKSNSTDSDPFFSVPEGGWAYEDCQVYPYSEEDALVKGSEDITHYQDDIYFISAGMEGPTGGGVDRSNITDPYTIGGIYLLDLSNSSDPVLSRATIMGLPESSNFRPHGLYLDYESKRLLVVSHNEQEKEENVVLFTIEESDDSSALPILIFQVALIAEQWEPVGNNLENWHLNDLVVAGPTEFLATQWGPLNLAAPTTKTLWSCNLEESYDNVPEDGRIMTSCSPALDFESLGLNGITIDEAKETAWVSDLIASQILEISRDASTPGNWTPSTTFPTPAVVDNLVYIDGTLHLAGPIKSNASLEPSNFIGTYMVGTRSDKTSMFVVEPVFQFDRAFLTQIGGAFVTTSVYPAGDLLVLGSTGYSGVVICSKTGTTEAEATGNDSSTADSSLSKFGLVTAFVIVVLLRK